MFSMTSLKQNEFDPLVPDDIAPRKEGHFFVRKNIYNSLQKNLTNKFFCDILNRWIVNLNFEKEIYNEKS